MTESMMAAGETMTTVEVTTTAMPGDQPRVLSLRVTPEQEVAIYAFFQINGWSIITEDVPKNCETCLKSINGEGTDPPRCQLCQRAIDTAIQRSELGGKSNQKQQASILQIQDHDGRKVVVLGNPVSMNEEGEQTENPTQIEIIKETPKESMVVKQVANPQPKIYNINNSPENRPYKCEDCGKYFRKKSHVVAHMRFHSGEALPKCNICGKEFLYKHNLISHSTIHSGERPFHCTMCPKNFRRKDDLQVHTRTHTGERPYKCDICGKCFTTQNQLPKHRRTHTGERPYECRLCSKCFRTKPHLEKHFRTHSGERPFKCSECGRAFTQNAHLVAHLRIHSGERPYHCDLCPKKFKESKTLRKHREIHVKGMPYTCKICNKGFLRQQNLEVHMCVHSEDEPKYKRRLREKKELYERLLREEEEEEEKLMAGGGQVLDPKDISYAVIAENGEQTIVPVTSLDDIKANSDAVKILSEDHNIIEIEHVDDSNSEQPTSISNSLLTLVEMITNADQSGAGHKGTPKVVQVSRSSSSVPKTIMSSITTSGTQQIREGSNIQVISSPQVGNIMTQDGNAVAQIMDQSGLENGVVITEVTDDNMAMAEQIIEHVQRDEEFVDGETFVMEVQYVDDGQETEATPTET